WRLVETFEASAEPKDDAHRSLRHKTIKKVTSDLEALKFNTAIAALMEYVNVLGQTASREDLVTLIKLVGPFAPHFGDEAWTHLSGAESGFLIQQTWPTYDESLTRDAIITLAVQINGKLRGNIDVEREAPREQIEKIAFAHENVTKHLEGKA